MNTIKTTLKATITKVLAFLLAAVVLAGSIGHAVSSLHNIYPINRVETQICFTGDGDGDNDPKTL